MNGLRVAAIQMTAGVDPRANLAEALRLIDQAAQRGAQWIALPEMFLCWGGWQTMVDSAETIPGPTSDALAATARRLGVTLVAGSYCERADAGRAFNTSLVIDASGTIVGRYRKRFRFDVELPGGGAVCESQWIAAGDGPSIVSFPWGRLGQAICYDLRFFECFQPYAQAEIELLVVPAAFMQATGRDHWHLLVRARAIELQGFVVAPNQTGNAGSTWHTYGHSLIVDPWGRVLADAGEDPGVIVAELSFDELRAVRKRMPLAAHRRREVDASKM